MLFEQPRANGAADTDEKRQIRLEVERYIKEHYRFHLFGDGGPPQALAVVNGPMVQQELHPFPTSTMTIRGAFWMRPRRLCEECEKHNPWRPVGWQVHFSYRDWNQFNPENLREAMRQNRARCLEHARGLFFVVAGWSAPKEAGDRRLEAGDKREHN